MPLTWRRAADPLLRQVRLVTLSAASRGAGRPYKPGSVVVSGFLNESFGVGQGARLTVEAFRSADLPTLTHDLRPLFERQPGDHSLPGKGGVWVLHCNPPEAIAAMARLPSGSWRNRYRIGYWAYELQKAPKDWLRAAALFHEIWTPSAFVADALRTAETPIRIMPHPVSPIETRIGDRRRFGLPASAFCVLAAADKRSSFERKNVFGAIEAYSKAFPDADGSTALVVKLLAARGDDRAVEAIRERTQGRRDIFILTEDLTRKEMLALIGSCDIVLSPHRSEGFGFLIAEAFAMGIPALATGWSGNLAFMEELGPLLLPSRLAPVRDSSGVYRRRGGQMWAEPDLDVAADRLRRMRSDPQLRSELGRAGQRRVAELPAFWARELASATRWRELVATRGAGEPLSATA